MSNPFTNRGLITSPDDFIGREQPMNEILGRVRSLQSASVVGERRIGKSSLLYQLAAQGNRRLGDEAYRFVYFDLLDAQSHTALEFFRAILQRLGLNAAAVNEQHTLTRNLIAFTEQLEAATQAGQRIVLCLNEFEALFKHPDEFTEDFFDHMRSQLDRRRFAVVTSTRTTLQTLCLDGKLTSPFYNVFTVLELGVFDDSEVKDFLAHYQPQAQFTEPELQFINSWLDPHPLKLQILCDWVWQNRTRQLADWALSEEIAKQYGNFFVGTFEAKQLRRAKRWFSLDFIGKLLDKLGKAKGLLSGTDEK